MIKLNLFFCLSLFGQILFAQGVEIGDRAPSFTLKNVNGKMVSLNDFQSEKGAIIVFTCNHCPYSIAYEDRIIAIDKKYKKLGFPVIAINPNDPKLQPADSFEEMVKRARKKRFTFPYLIDEMQHVFPAYGATKTPHIFLLIKNDGIFEIAYIGAIDNNHENENEATQKHLVNALEEIIIQKPVSVPKTKAIGCSIKTNKK